MADQTDAPDDELPPYLKDGTTGEAIPQPLNKPTPEAVQPERKVVQLPGTQPKPTKRPRTVLDVDRIAVDYSTGLLTLREIARRHGCAASRVVQLAQQHGWKQDIRAKARLKAEHLLNSPEPPRTNGAEHALGAIASEVDQTAQAMAFIRHEHRGILKRGRTVMARLLQEVEEASHGQLFLELFEAAQRESDPEKKMDYLKRGAEKLLTLPSRIYGINKLSVAAKNLIMLERQAFDLDAPDAGKPPPPRDASMSPAEVYSWLSQLKP